MEEEVREILRDATKQELFHQKGLGTRIASRFRKASLKKGEEIPELHNIQLELPDFEE